MFLSAVFNLSRLAGEGGYRLNEFDFTQSHRTTSILTFPRRTGEGTGCRCSNPYRGLCPRNLLFNHLNWAVSVHSYRGQSPRYGFGLLQVCIESIKRSSENLGFRFSDDLIFTCNPPPLPSGGRGLGRGWLYGANEFDFI